MFTKYIMMVIVAGSAALLACSSEISTEAASNQKKEDRLSPNELGKISGKRIYFGHMSVGNNIMEGVQEILQEYPDAKIVVRETEAMEAAEKGLFAHSPIGDNWHPLKKIDNFSKKVNDGIGGAADIAFFKFCYIDMMADQDAEKVFESYKRAMENLKQQFPETAFVHVTVPLTVVQTGWKVPIKRLIGRAPGGYLDNINRNRYNQMLQAAYAGKEPIFDLAAIEAATPAGGQTIFEWDGKQYISLYPGYASDGRHLNEQGRRHVAQKLLLFLGDVE